MRKPSGFLTKVRPDGRRYLLLLNDAETFARAAGVTDPDMVAALRSYAATVRTFFIQRRQIVTRVREVVQAYRLGDLPEAEAEFEGDMGMAPPEGAQAFRGLATLMASWDVLKQGAIAMGKVPVGRARVARRKVAELLARLNVGPTGSIATCRLCDQAFYWSPKRRAQKFCPRCRRRWSPQQLWYRAKHKGKPVKARRKARSMGGGRT